MKKILRSSFWLAACLLLLIPSAGPHCLIPADAKTPAVTTGRSTDRKDADYSPYSKIVNDLEKRYGKLELIQSGYYEDIKDAWEYKGLCLLTLLDMDGTGPQELFAVCKKEKEELYKGYVYTIKDGEAKRVFKIDDVTLSTNGGFFNITINHADGRARIVCSPKNEDAQVTALYGFFDGKYQTLEYKCPLPSASDTTEDAYYINGKEVDEKTYYDSIRKQGLSDLSSEEENTVIYVRTLNKDYLEIKKLTDMNAKTKAMINK